MIDNKKQCLTNIVSYRQKMNNNFIYSLILMNNSSKDNSYNEYADILII